MLLTGALWAKTSWGVYWEWKEPTLVSLPDRLPALRDLPADALRDRGPRPPGADRRRLRDRLRRLRAAELHRRAAWLESLIHPRVLTATGDNLPTEMRITFYVALIAAVLLWVALWKFELVAKSVSMQVKKLEPEYLPR